MRGPGGRDYHLEGRVLGGVGGRVVGLVHLGEGERVGAHLLRRDAAAGHHLQQGRDGHPASPGTREPLTDVIPAASEITRGSQVPLRNAVPVTFGGKWSGALGGEQSRSVIPRAQFSSAIFLSRS